MRTSIAVAALALGWGAMACADDWGEVAQVSTTMGVHGGRICIGESSRGDLGCPADAPTVSGNTVSGTFVGDGSGLTGVVASSGGDRIVSGTTSFIAVSDTGYISLTQAGVNTGWFSPYAGLVTLGVSSTGGISGTTGYFSGRVGIGTNAPQDVLHLVSDTHPRLLLSNNSSGNGASDGLQLSLNQNHAYLLNRESGYLFLGTSATARLGINSTGRVGIAGTSSFYTSYPSSTLHVGGAVQIANNGETCDSDRAGAMRYTSASTFDFCDGVSGWRSLAAMASAGGVTTDRVVSGSTQVIAMNTGTISASTSKAGGDFATVLWNSTTNTSGTSTGLDMPVFNGTAGLRVRSMGSSTGGFNTGNYDGFIHTGQGASYLHFAGGAQQGGVIKHMTITNLGRVGISTTNPQTALQVSGTIRIADGNETCDANRSGALRYTSASTFDFCDGVSGWRSLAAMASAGGVTTDRIVSGSSNVVAMQDRSVTISTAGSARMLVGENGRVGIGTGTAAPSATLQVSGTALFGTSTPGSVGGMVDVRTGRVSSSALAVTGNNASEMLKMWVDDATSYIQTGQDEFAAGDTNFAHMALVLGNKTQFNPIFGIYNGTTGSNMALLRVLHDGRAALGYGAFVPSTTLHVKGSLRFGEETSSTLAACDADRAGAMRYTSQSTFDFCDGVSGWRSLAAMASAGGVTDRIVSGTSSVMAINSASVTISTAGTQRVVVGANGWVGIGTITPTVPLEVASGAGSVIQIGYSSPAWGINVRAAQSSSWARYYGFQDNAGTVLGAFGAYGPANGLTYTFLGASYATPSIVIRADNQRVGISTTNPSRTLTVNGDAAVSGTVQVAGTGGEVCGPGLRGTIRQNPISKKLEVCRQ